MNTHKVALKVKQKMDNSRMFQMYNEKDHLYYMIEQIQKMDQNIPEQNEKSHRWIGWLQAVVVEHSEMNLEDMKNVNKDNYE